MYYLVIWTYFLRTDGRISFAEFRKNLISAERNYFINKGNINISVWFLCLTIFLYTIY